MIVGQLLIKRYFISKMVLRPQKNIGFQVVINGDK